MAEKKGRSALPPPAAVEDEDEVPARRSAVEVVAVDLEELPEDLFRLLRRQAPPTGTFRRAPPRVQ